MHQQSHAMIKGEASAEALINPIVNYTKKLLFWCKKEKGATVHRFTPEKKYKKV